MGYGFYRACEKHPKSFMKMEKTDGQNLTELLYIIVMKAEIS